MITIRGQILVSRTNDDPPASSRVWIQNVPVCTFKTSPCVPAPRAHEETHVRVVLACTRTFGMDTRRRVGIHIRFFLVFFSVPQHKRTHQTHTTTTTTHTTQHHNTQHHTETETETDRNRERQRKRNREGGTRQDKKREDETRKERQEKRRNEKMKEERRDM